MSVVDRMAIALAERGWVPDFAIEWGIRRLLAGILVSERTQSAEQLGENLSRLVDMLSTSPIAIEMDAANRQHYQVPTPFYQKVLGKRLKYSSCYYATGRESLDEAELAMLDRTIAHAELADGQRILELGCGWGSLTLTMAERFPKATILGVSNSATQRQFIEAEASRRGLANLSIRTEDVNRLELDARFDRVVSVEMFEHVRNYRHLLERIAGWLVPEGKLFVHIFCHRQLAYPFQAEGQSEADDWMSRHFFTGGLMPSQDLLLRFARHLVIERQWWFDGTHYERTARHWLENLDRHRSELLTALKSSPGGARLQLQRWRMFFLACAELFGYRNGKEWMVCHYRFCRRTGTPDDESPSVWEAFAASGSQNGDSRAEFSADGSIAVSGTAHEFPESIERSRSQLGTLIERRGEFP